MKKVFYIIIPLILLGYLVVLTLLPRAYTKKPETPKDTTAFQVSEDYENYRMPEHSGSERTCRSCHLCEIPTKADPCLLECPRGEMVSVHHSPKEGPDVVLINEMSENYSGVVFSHRLHAEMSVISGGCKGCHHYNTTGPVLNCRKCHDKSRARENVSVPDLKAAYHRQCISCHDQWSSEKSCDGTCHSIKGSENDKKKQEMIKQVSGKTHPTSSEPTKKVWETNYEKGKLVTFYHDEHVKLFKLDCNSCHKNDNCINCHPRNKQNAPGKPVRIKKSIEEHHMRCNDCHAKDDCNKCHTDKEMGPFNHQRASGWNLGSNHSRLACERCHGDIKPYRKLDRNCKSCHSNFTKEKFNHAVTGIILDEVHLEADCKNCHIDEDFSKAPSCKECHENDKSYPKDIPGKRK